MKSTPVISLALIAFLAACSESEAPSEPVGGSATAQADAPAVEEWEPEWAHLQSDIPADPDVIFGELDNGMRYAVMANDTPDGAAALRMRFGVGALAEADDQNGLTHFLEHMVFNGSENVPEGELVKILEREGLRFGPDTNAYTALDETVYILNLPKAASLETGLFLFREAADKLTLDPDAIDRERGVILQERAVRDTPGRRRTEAYFEFLLPAGLPSRRISDDPEVVRNAPREQFLEIYQGYYRPERTMLVAVGDFDPQETVAQIEEAFADFAQPGVGAPDPDLGGAPERDGPEATVFVDPGSETYIQITGLATDDPSDDLQTMATARAALLRQLGNAVLSRRFQTIASDPQSVIQGGYASGSELFDAFDLSAVGVLLEPEDWRAGMAVVEQEWRRLRTHGATQAEIDEQLANIRAALESAARGADTRQNGALADGIVQAYAAQDVFTDPATDLAFFDDVAPSITPQAVSNAFRTHWVGPAPLIFVSTKEEIAGGADAGPAAFAESGETPVDPPAAAVEAAFAYEDFGPIGAVSSESRIEDLDVDQAVFENHVRLNVKRTDFEKDVVRIRVVIDGGQLTAPESPASLHLLAQNGFLAGGLEAHSADELSRLLAGVRLQRGFSLRPDAFVLDAQTTPADLRMALNVLAAQVAAPGYREEALTQHRRGLTIQYDAFESTPIGVFQRDVTRALFGGDPRFGLPPTLEEALAPDLAALEAWLAPALAEGAMEISVVGDVDPAMARAAVAATFGALPPRRAKRAEAATADMTPPARAATVRTHQGPAQAALAAGLWPAAVSGDLETWEAAELTAAVLNLKMTERIREQEGASYTTQAGLAVDPSLPNWGAMFAYSDPAADRIDGVLGLYQVLAAEMRDGAVSEDELARARTPRLEQLRQQQERNSYWLAVLSESQAKPEVLERHRNRIAVLEALTIEDLAAIAKAYLQDEAMASFVVRPADEN